MFSPITPPAQPSNDPYQSLFDALIKCLPPILQTPSAYRNKLLSWNPDKQILTSQYDALLPLMMIKLGIFSYFKIETVTNNFWKTETTAQLLTTATIAAVQQRMICQSPSDLFNTHRLVAEKILNIRRETYQKIKINFMPHLNEQSPRSKHMTTSINELYREEKYDITQDIDFHAILALYQKYKQSRYHTESPNRQYFTQSEHHQYGVSEILGRRPTQEDTVAYSSEAVTDFPKLPREKQIKALAETFATLQKEYGNRPNVGTTCCNAITWITDTLHIVTTNLGDSATYLVKLRPDEQGKLTPTTVLLNKLHNPAITVYRAEYERVVQCCIENKAVFPANGRLSSTLAITRTIGDTASEKAGLIHEPEMHFYRSTDIQPTDKLFVLVACDGLLEHNALSLQDIGQLVLEKHEDMLDDIAAHLTATAFSKGVNDNISVCITRPTAQPNSLLICDGHGDDITALETGEAYHAVLQQRIAHQCTLPANKEEKTLLALDPNTTENTLIDLAVVKDNLCKDHVIGDSSFAYIQNDNSTKLLLINYNGKQTISRTYMSHILTVLSSKHQHPITFTNTRLTKSDSGLLFKHHELIAFLHKLEQLYPDGKTLSIEIQRLHDEIASQYTTKPTSTNVSISPVDASLTTIHTENITENTKTSPTMQ